MPIFLRQSILFTDMALFRSGSKPRVFSYVLKTEGEMQMKARSIFFFFFGGGGIYETWMKNVVARGKNCRD